MWPGQGLCPSQAGRWCGGCYRDDPGAAAEALGDAAELGLHGPCGPAKVIGWSGCTLTAAYEEMTGAIDSARLPFLLDFTGRDPASSLSVRGSPYGYL